MRHSRKSNLDPQGFENLEGLYLMRGGTSADILTPDFNPLKMNTNDLEELHKFGKKHFLDKY